MEDQTLIEEGPARLVTALEARIEALLEARRRDDRQRRALEARQAELLARVERARLHEHDLEARVAELEARLAEAEAERIELAEENRELDAQNRELEAHGRRLQARLDGEAEAPVFQRAARQSRGLSALIGTPRRPRPEVPPAEAATDDAPAPAQNALPIERAPSPQALLAEWYRRYPDTFFKGHTRPLQIGIHQALAAHEPWPEKLVRRALACYVNLPRYLKAVREGAERLDLAGRPAGVVDREAAEHARRKLERLQADRRRKVKRSARRPSGGATSSAAPGKAASSSAPGPAPQPPAGDDAPDGDRLQRKLDALMAQHNAR
ncbi:ProQ/FINO family protein [Halomonas koreensis]|uniref:ProQ/FINO family protein n=1 Tax=Halomonas koreensis TaxID=245385 RepID=A0ABU1G5G7_9GAMM|nr:ProQ/FINO family protein [Halomonas koreensis]MDR5868145.1 ProQ/FINO family protein [Halomonas koreensis]